MRYRNAALFCLLTAIWGSAFVAIKAGLGDPANPAYFYDAPVFFAAIRYEIAGLLMLPYAAWATSRWRPRGREEWLLVAIGATLMIGAYHAFLFVGQRGTTSAAAAVIISLSPVLTAAFARALLPDERLSLLGIVGMVLGLVGVVVLTRPSLSNLVGSRFEAFVFAAAASFALGSVLARRFETGLPIETMEAWSMLGGGLLMHAVSVGLDESVSGLPPLREATAMVYLVVVSSALGFLLYFDLLDRLGPIEINLVSYVAPPVAALTGFLVLGERIDAATVVGFLIIVAGFVLIKRRAIRSELRRHYRR